MDIYWPLIYNSFILLFLGPTESPESLVRVEEMLGKKITFYKANLCDRESLKVPFQKVCHNYKYCFAIRTYYNIITHM